MAVRVFSMCILKWNFVVLFASKGRKSNVKIHEDANGNIYTVGVTMKPVNSAQDVSFTPFYSIDLMSNSSCFLWYIFYHVPLENLIFDQLILSTYYLIFFFIPVICLSNTDIYREICY